MSFRKRNAFRRKLCALGIGTSERKTAGTEAPSIHDAVAGRPVIARIFMERIPHGAAQVAVPEKRRNLGIRGNLSPGNKPDGSIDSLCK